MSRFIPNLDPSQVYTSGEYLVSHQIPISIAMMPSVDELDMHSDAGERTKYAMLASFNFNGTAYRGVVSVTTHNFYCCSSVNGDSVLTTMPLKTPIGIGAMRGRLFKRRLPIHCDAVAVEVVDTADNLNKLTEALLSGIEYAAAQKPLPYPPKAGVTTQSKAQREHIQKIKNPYTNVRRLSKSEMASYGGKCAFCGSKMLSAKKEESGGEIVFCIKCGKDFGPLKR